MKCLCCRNTFDEFETEYVCSYCGFANFDTLDDSVDSGVDQLVKEYRRGNDYRKKLLSHIISSGVLTMLPDLVTPYMLIPRIPSQSDFFFNLSFKPAAIPVN